VARKLKRKWKRQNIIRCSAWTVNGIAHKEEELDSVLRNSIDYRIRKESKGTLETDNYIVICSGIREYSTYDLSGELTVRERLTVSK